MGHGDEHVAVLTRCRAGRDADAATSRLAVAEAKMDMAATATGNLGWEGNWMWDPGEKLRPVRHDMLRVHLRPRNARDFFAGKVHVLHAGSSFFRIARGVALHLRPLIFLSGNLSRRTSARGCSSERPISRWIRFVPGSEPCRIFKSVIFKV